MIKHRQIPAENQRGFYSLNNSPTERPSCARRMTSPSIGATERIVMRSLSLSNFSPESGALSVVMI